MHATDPPSDDAIGTLLKQAADAVYCRPAQRHLGVALPADDSLIAAALHEAADRRDAKAFSHLYLAANPQAETLLGAEAP